MVPGTVYTVYIGIQQSAVRDWEKTRKLKSHVAPRGMQFTRTEQQTVHRTAVVVIGTNLLHSGLNEDRKDQE